MVLSDVLVPVRHQTTQAVNSSTTDAKIVRNAIEKNAMIDGVESS